MTMESNQRAISLKTAVNTRIPIDHRSKPIQSQLYTNSTTTTTTANGSSNASFRTSSPTSGTAVAPKRHFGETSYSAGTKSVVASAADVPKRGKDIHSTSDAVPSAFDAASTQHVAMSNQLANGLHENFFSTVRQLERKDDDVRKTGKGSQRTTDIMNKREGHEDMQPPTTEFIRCTRRSPADLLPAPNTAGNVTCQHIGGQSTNHTDYLNPLTIFPPVLCQANETQRRVLSETGTEADLFSGTAKGRADVLPGFMGHCPSNPKNKASIKGEVDEILRPYSKCSVNLATSSANTNAMGTAKRTKSPECRAVTVSGFFLEQALSSSAAERSLNRRVKGVR